MSAGAPATGAGAGAGSPSGARRGVPAWLLFALLCAVWGSTWLSLKIGVAAAPPVLFASGRFLLAVPLLFAWAAWRGVVRVPAATLLPGALLMVAVNYGLMAWGIVRVASGIASVINLATVPAATLLIGILLGEARWSWRAGLALLLGTGGLALLFAPRFGAAEAGGMAAIAAGAACYAWGGLLTKRRPTADPVALAAWQGLAGGALLLVASLVLEPVDAATFAALAAPGALANLAFLAFAGAVVGASVYLMLLARWDAARVSAYAFVCPLIALAEGAAIAGEMPGTGEIGASVLLLAATFFSLTARHRG